MPVSRLIYAVFLALESRVARTTMALLTCSVFAMLATGCASLPAHVEKTPSAAEPLSTDTPLGKIAAISAPSPELSGFRLMPIGSYALNTRLTLAQRAQKTLDVQYYLIQNDETGRYLLRTLRDAALRGVRVRLLIDDLYTSGEDELLAGLAAYPNVEVRLFNPFPGGRQSIYSRFAASAADIRRVNHRMHNKLFIADGAMAVAGGRNIGNEYFMRSQRENFVDLDSFVVGAVVPQLADLFDDYWNSEYVYPVESIVKSTAAPEALRARFEALTDASSTPPPDPVPPNDVLGYGPIAEDLDAGRLGLIWAIAFAYADQPSKVDGMTNGDADNDTVRYNVLELMRNARSEIILSSPYFIPGSGGMDMLRSVRKRNVRVRVMTNSLAATDEPLVHTGYIRYRHEMLSLGVELYELSPTRIHHNKRLGMFGTSIGRLHAKTAVIDRQTVFIGSMNFDPRSAHSNTELGIIIQSPQVAREVVRLMDIDKLQSSYRLRLADDGTGIEWLTIDQDKERVQAFEPDASFWIRFELSILAPFAPESLL